jgi:hypothetical protein
MGKRVARLINFILRARSFDDYASLLRAKSFGYWHINRRQSATEMQNLSITSPT